MTRGTLADILGIAGAVAIVYGVAQVAPAFAWIVGGLIGWAAAYLHALADSNSRDSSGPTS